MEDSGESREHGVSLLLHRRKIAADAAKSRDPSGTAKGARNLLLDFGPAQIPLGLVVGKRYAQVVEQGQHLLGTQKQGIEQILALALLASALAFCRGRRRWWRLSRIARGQDLAHTARPIRRVRWGEPRSGGADETRDRRHADRARSPASPPPIADGPAQRLPHNRARDGLHRCCAHSHSHHSSPVDRACLARQSAARCRFRPWPPDLARHATSDGSESGCSSHAANAACHTRGCPFHLHVAAGWPRSARQCARPSAPAARRPVRSTAARWLARCGSHTALRAPHTCEPWAAIAPGADTRPTPAGGDHIAQARSPRWESCPSWCGDRWGNKSLRSDARGPAGAFPAHPGLDGVRRHCLGQC